LEYSRCYRELRKTGEGKKNFRGWLEVDAFQGKEVDCCGFLSDCEIAGSTYLVPNDERNSLHEKRYRIVLETPEIVSENRGF